ncbi:MAG: DUF2029 domain-containing protein [Rhizobiales bacterium]|nr:DUF2029 domain-containing protein [Hyphomicrobiales bacterium]MBN9009480.1 DUF2029 domain-containing protein [Hyphomicrobiales bacterium]
MARTTAGRRATIALVAVGLVAAAVLAVQLVRRPGEWDGVYVDAARKLIGGGDIYGPESSFLYPPFPAVLAIPFIWLGVPAMRVVWFVVNAVCLVFAFRWSWIVGGGRSAPISPRGLVAAVLATVIGGTYALNAIAHQQTDVVIVFLMAGGALALSLRRDALSGALLGLSAAFKATPLIWVAYLLLSRRFLSAIVLVAVFALLCLVPDLLWPSPDGRPWVVRWLEQYVLPSQSLATPVGLWGSDIIFNQSLGGLLQRLINLTMPLPGAEPVDDALVPSMILRPVTLALLAAFAAISFLAARRGRVSASRMPETDGLEYGLVVAVMLLASPMSSPAHFVALLLPAFALACHAARTDSRGSWATLGIAALLALLGNKDIAGPWLYDRLLWHGGATLATLALWLGGLMALWRSKPAPARSAARPASAG